MSADDWTPLPGDLVRASTGDLRPDGVPDGTYQTVTIKRVHHGMVSVRNGRGGSTVVAISRVQVAPELNPRLGLR